jgi:processive 1,2-diacylglycerol beta-glucosyltransferase
MIFHASAGHGHRKVAEVLAKEFEQRRRPDLSVTVEDSLDSTPLLFKKSYTGIYFYAVKYISNLWGWSYEILDHAAVYALIRPLRSFSNWLNGRKLLARVIQEAPEVIICTHFFTAELFATAKKKGQLKSKLITVITDFLPHTFWVNEGTDVYWVMGSDGAENLMRRGVPHAMIRPLGIPIDDAFKPQNKKNVLRKKYGFSEGRLTLLLTSGSFGFGPHEAILKELEAFKDRIQCFVVCGNNAELKTTLENNKFGFPLHVYGFVSFMDELMETSDLLIAKTGGATTSESLAKGLPMVVLEPIPGQETRNADVLKNNRAAFFMVLPEQIKPIIQTILENPVILEEKRRNIAALAKPNATQDLVTFVIEHGNIKR